MKAKLFNGKNKTKTCFDKKDACLAVSKQLHTAVLLECTNLGQVH